MLRDLATLPFQVASGVGKVASSMVDAVTGGSTINIDRTHPIEGQSASAWANEFERDPSRISPVSVGQERHGRTASGRPFPGGPRVEITVTGRRDSRTHDGRNQVELDVQYGGDFRGPGKMTITEQPGGGLAWRDEWRGVENCSHLPARAAEVGHPIVSSIGASGIGRSSMRRR
jgi:hypothetical protein